MREERKLASRAKMKSKTVSEWTIDDVVTWLSQSGHGDPDIIEKFKEHEIDGKALLILKEDDLKSMSGFRIGAMKRLYISIKQLQRDNVPLLLELGCLEMFTTQTFLSHKNSDVSIFINCIIFY